MRIAITDCCNEGKMTRYLEWLRSFSDSAEIVVLSHHHDAADLSSFDGLVLSGGEDVDPELSKAEPRSLVQTTDRARDDFEIAVLGSAMQNALPVLGICRGMQLANVYFGGSLVADLPDAGYLRHSASAGQPPVSHDIMIRRGSVLNAITGRTAGTINSYHHQSVKECAAELMVSAESPDGVPEAAEWKQPAGRPFLLLVQWHPERITDRTNPLTTAVGTAFFQAVKSSNEENR